jgi:pilus assembly protein CpaE
MARDALSYGRKQSRPAAVFAMFSEEAAVILATVSSDPDFHKDVRASLDGHLRFEAMWDLTYEDANHLRAIGPELQCILIVNFADLPRAMPVARAVDGRPQIAVIAVKGGGSREDLLQLMQAGVREVLPNFTDREIRQAAVRAASTLATAGEILADLYTFMPAKPGCGGTTIATYATSMAAQLSTEPTLLLDFDIRLGVTSFLLKAEGSHTIVDALLQSDRLDVDIWSSLVSQIKNLHLLGSGPMDFSQHVSSERFMELLDFAMRRYSLVAVDVPGTMEDQECETLLRSKAIYLVCTPDIGALHVARRKAVWLRDLHLTDKVSVVLNCVERRSTLSVDDIQRIIQLPIRHMLPAGASEISRAVQKGAVLDSSSGLGKHIARIAAEMSSTRPSTKKPGAVRRFVEYFSISAARDVQT